MITPTPQKYPHLCFLTVSARLRYISEQQFEILGQSTHSTPEEDSPGDSDQAAGEEFLMGLNYMPDKKNEFENAGVEPGEIVFSDE
jgi:hypothetical protein